MLAPAFSVSRPPPVLRPSPQHYSPVSVTNSCFFRPPGRPDLRRVYKLPLQERAERHFKGHGLPQASVLSREIGLTTLLPALSRHPPFSPRAPPLRAHAPPRLLSDGAPPCQVIPPGLREGAGLQEGGIEGAGTKEHSVAGDWTKSTKGGKQSWRGRNQGANTGVCG